MKKYFLFSLILFNVNLCYASLWCCDGINIIDTSISAESYCKPYISVQAPNQEGYLRNKQMYQNCLNGYNNDKAKIGMNNGYCKPATKRTYKGSCGEIVTEYLVSGKFVRGSSTGGDVTCLKRKWDAENKKLIEEMYNK